MSGVATLAVVGGDRVGTRRWPLRLMIKAGPSGAAASEPTRNGSGLAGPISRFAPINKLRLQLRAGMGEMHAMQREVQRMQRTTTELAELPRVVHVIEDVTRNLGLEKADEDTIQRAIQGTSAEFTPKTQTQRIFLARGMLAELLRSMKHVDGDARMEIAKRAAAWWKKASDTDLNRPARLGISYARSMNKGSKPVRWITVSGAHVPIGSDGEMMGELGKKLMLHRKKKTSGDSYSHEVGAAVRGIARVPRMGSGGVPTAKRVAGHMGTSAVGARKVLKEAEGHGLVDYDAETKGWSLTAKGRALAAEKPTPIDEQIRQTVRKSVIAFPLSRVAPDLV